MITAWHGTACKVRRVARRNWRSVFSVADLICIQSFRTLCRAVRAGGIRSAVQCGMLLRRRPLGAIRQYDYPTAAVSTRRHTASSSATDARHPSIQKYPSARARAFTHRALRRPPRAATAVANCVRARARQQLAAAAAAVVCCAPPQLNG